MPSNFDRFVKIWAEYLRAAVTKYPNDYPWPLEDLPEVVEQMVAELRRGHYDKDGFGFKWTTKKLGIPHTYQAINAFLDGDDSVVSAHVGASERVTSEDLWQRMRQGERVIASGRDMDYFEDKDEPAVKHLNWDHNPDRVGTLDAYVAWLDKGGQRTGEPKAKRANLKRGTKKRIKEAIALQDLVREWALDHGGYETKNSSPAMMQAELNTVYGPFKVSVPGAGGEGFEDLTTITIFGRFADPAAASDAFGNVNQYSGKWNHHYEDDTTADEAFDNWLRVSARLFDDR